MSIDWMLLNINSLSLICRMAQRVVPKLRTLSQISIPAHNRITPVNLCKQTCCSLSKTNGEYTHSEFHVKLKRDTSNFNRTPSNLREYKYSSTFLPSNLSSNIKGPGLLGASGYKSLASKYPSHNYVLSRNSSKLFPDLCLQKQQSNFNNSCINRVSIFDRRNFHTTLPWFESNQPSSQVEITVNALKEKAEAKTKEKSHQHHQLKRTHWWSKSPYGYGSKKKFYITIMDSDCCLLTQRSVWSIATEYWMVTSCLGENIGRFVDFWYSNYSSTNG